MKLSQEIIDLAYQVLLVCQCRDYTDAYLLRDGTVSPWEEGWQFIDGQWYCPKCAWSALAEKSLKEHADIWRELANL